MNALLGRCDITLLTNRQEIEAAEIHYVRPEIEHALIGLEPQNAIDVLGHLPNACRISHQLAASYVLGCSTGTLLRQVNHEWINTHAMQLFFNAKQVRLEAVRRFNNISINCGAMGYFRATVWYVCRVNR